MMKITYQITGLHSKQEEIKNSILTSYAKYHTICASRQSGKGYLLYKLATGFALFMENIKIGVICPTYSQSKIIYDRILTIPNIMSKIESKTQTPPVIRFKNKSVIEFRTSDNPDNIRGSTYNFVFLDEAAFVSEETFNTVIRPTTAAVKDSKIIFTSTPRGKHGIFFKHFTLGETGDSNYKSYRMHYTDNPVYDINERNDAEKMLPELIFRQEYEAEFIEDSGTVFTNINSVCTLTSFANITNRCYAGLDLGRTNDFTALHIFNQSGQTVKTYYINNTTWNDILLKIVAILEQFKPVLLIESNGVGDVMYESIAAKYYNCEPFLTTNQSKQMIIEQLKLDMENKEITLPSKELDEKLYNEFSTFTFTITSSRNIKYGAMQPFHDDCIMALAIANQCRRLYKVGFKATAYDIEDRYKY